MTQLDRIDFELITLLRNNARISNKDLAEAVGLAQSTCLVRVRSLQSRGVLKGFHAEVDSSALGVGLQAMISIRLERHSKSDVEAFRAHAREHPEDSPYRSREIGGHLSAAGHRIAAREIARMVGD